MRITDKFVFFWNGIYSQWYPCNFTINNITYNCAEQYMMHQKALLFNDSINASLILLSDSPKEQKAIGRTIKNFNIEIWNKYCLSVVYKGTLEKFRQNNNMKIELLATIDRIIVEASPVDNIWGIGLAEDNLNCEDPSKWKGLNLLGNCLMLVRNQLNYD